jgi:hypothetical protein
MTEKSVEQIAEEPTKIIPSRIFKAEKRVTNPEYARDYYARHRARCRQISHAYKLKNRVLIAKRDSARRYRLKIDVMSHYSNEIKCCKCGIADIRVLCLDHINGHGQDHLRSIKVSAGMPFYKWVRDNGYPHGYQILCLNCNVIKRIENNEYRKKYEEKEND